MVCPTGEPDWSGVTLETFNVTLLTNPRLCNSCICPLKIGDDYFLGFMDYYPSLAGNALFAAIFGLLLLLQLFFGIRYKTWGFMIGMAGGLVLEVLGYIARILMRDNMFTDTYFIMYLVCLTIGPAFLSAAIYLTLSRLVVIYGAEHARLRPQMYTYVFIGCDVVALILQAAGGAIASTAPPFSQMQRSGINTMVAGVAWQVAALLLFAGASLDFWLRARSGGGRTVNDDDPAWAQLRSRRLFQPAYIVAVFLAALFVFVRSVFRCAELSEGFGGPLANDEVTFMVLEGTMIILACALLTGFHPGIVLGGKAWSVASWKSSNNNNNGSNVVVDGQQVVDQSARFGSEKGFSTDKTASVRGV